MSVSTPAYSSSVSAGFSGSTNATVTPGSGNYPSLMEIGFMAATAPIGGPEVRAGIGATKVVGESFLKALGGESQVYRSTSLGARYIDQLVGGTANESKVGYTTLTQTIQKQIAKDSELLGGDPTINAVTWHFFESPVTGAGGASAPLIDALEKAGISVVQH